MDQYHGQGGSYLLDPETGERVLLERTGAPRAEPRTEPKPRRRATADVNEAWQ